MLNKLHDNLNKLTDAFSEIYADDYKSYQFDEINKNKIELIIHKLSLYGWYIDNFSLENTNFIKKYLGYIYRNNLQQLDLELSRYYYKRLKEIETKLILDYPNRSEIIKEAFEVHKLKYYRASICLFITIIDGICHENFEAKFFKNKKHLPEIKKELEKYNYKKSEFLLSPIRKKGSINGYENNLEDFPVRLNRHEIIHGIDINFGKEIDSLKIISLLSYINYIINHFKK